MPPAPEVPTGTDDPDAPPPPREHLKAFLRSLPPRARPAVALGLAVAVLAVAATLLAGLAVLLVRLLGPDWGPAAMGGLLMVAGLTWIINETLEMWIKR